MRTRLLLIRRLAALLGLLLANAVAAAGVREVGPITLSVADLDRELAFYTNTLPFRLVHERHTSGVELDQFTGLTGSHTRTAILQLGSESIELEQFLAPRGRPIPSDLRSFDHWFQHIAIAVADTDRSLGFYRDALGLGVAGSAENWGVEQEHLNQVFGARLRITALRAEKGPGIEFLEYLTPPGGRPLPADSRANDLLAWRVRLEAERLELPSQVKILGSVAGRALVRDPDGHVLELRCAHPLPITHHSGPEFAE